MARRRLLAVAAIDCAMLAELAAAVYFANRHAAEFTPVFLKVFFGMLIPTLAAGGMALRRMNAPGKW
jgi:hypothetical protein